ncbi:hypothetical protein, conserved [Eimeria tenella]|uniref:Uncharacterized protein n=1 Tax=Eimeria tenella TaxID=5802 RepID=U6KWF4_EIMTE|nr:hypothetical protein, conserved [Eimeria tenella]CDJ40689.1 hypothetical protein, conserved [Eimeria tenella]|eukprot:XP_013231439.1 hypothetical protein, conserved [Eimeria tenella]
MLHVLLLRDVVVVLLLQDSCIGERSEGPGVCLGASLSLLSSAAASCSSSSSSSSSLGAPLRDCLLASDPLEAFSAVWISSPGDVAAPAAAADAAAAAAADAAAAAAAAAAGEDCEGLVGCNTFVQQRDICRMAVECLGCIRSSWKEATFGGVPGLLYYQHLHVISAAATFEELCPYLETLEALFAAAGSSISTCTALRAAVEHVVANGSGRGRRRLHQEVLSAAQKSYRLAAPGSLQGPFCCLRGPSSSSSSSSSSDRYRYRNVWDALQQQLQLLQQQHQTRVFTSSVPGVGSACSDSSSSTCCCC